MPAVYFAMIEDGPDTFMQRWRRFAAEGVVFARPEGSPLLEVELDGVVVQLLERTNPYLGTPGRKRVLVQPTTEAVETPGDEEGADGSRVEPFLEVPSRGALRAQGRVLEREGRLLVVDAGAPLLVDVVGMGPEEGPREGDLVRFTARPPVHGFVVPTEATGPGASTRDVDEAP